MVSFAIDHYNKDKMIKYQHMRIGVEVMNRTKLKEAEERFYMQYPGGFSNPLMLEIAKNTKWKK